MHGQAYTTVTVTVAQVECLVCYVDFANFSFKPRNSVERERNKMWSKSTEETNSHCTMYQWLASGSDSN